MIYLEVKIEIRTHKALLENIHKSIKQTSEKRKSHQRLMDNG